MLLRPLTMAIKGLVGPDSALSPYKISHAAGRVGIAFVRDATMCILLSIGTPTASESFRRRSAKRIAISS
jgi:hypothetical protein